MPCWHPLQAYRGREVNASGKRALVFNPAHGYEDRPVKVPCGQCSGCRLEKSRQWAMRCMHEAQLHTENAFITLTYEDEHLPTHGSLDVRDWQLFMKRLRKQIEPKKVRFFHCGEYGKKRGRPHYHACLFGHDFEDKKQWKVINGNILYQSSSLSDLWGLGFCSTGAVTFQSAAYVARYIMEKITGRLAVSHYTTWDPDTGEVLTERTPEYTTMSRRPGLGRGWYDTYRSDVYPSDEVVINGGHACRPPKYYDGLYEIDDPANLREIKRRRRAAGRVYAAHNTPARLRVREKIQEARLRRLPRNIEENL